MKIISVNIGTAQKVPGKPSGKSGIFKSPVSGSVMIDAEGLVGDAIINRKHHGGVDQAVYIECEEDLVWWSQELKQPILPGTFGENLVISGLTNQSVSVGDRFAAGEVVLEVTSPRIPCSTFAARMNDRLFVKRYTKAARPGFYCRVLQSGMIASGMNVAWTPHQGTRLTVMEMMATYKKALKPADLERYLSTPLHYKSRAELEKQKAQLS